MQTFSSSTIANGRLRAALVALAFVLSSCGSTQTSVCDPITIEQSGRCFWSKEEACDAAGCLPPSECIITDSKPGKVECKKPAP